MTTPAAPAADDAALALRAFALWPAGFGGLWLRGPGPARDALVERLGTAVHLRRMPAHIDGERLHGGIDLAASLAAGRSVTRSGFLEEAQGSVVLAPLAERITPALAGSVAVGCAILAMSLLRCFHPPGGACALTAVIGSPAIHAAGFSFAFLPVALNSVALVLFGLLFHRVSRHSYPHRPMPAPPEAAAAGLHLADIDAALEDMHESFDISRADLDALLSRAEFHAERRKLG